MVASLSRKCRCLCVERLCFSDGHTFWNLPVKLTLKYATQSSERSEAEITNTQLEKKLISKQVLISQDWNETNAITIPDVTCSEKNTKISLFCNF